MPIAAQHLKSARLHLQKCDPTMKKIIKAVGPCTLKTRTDRFQVLVDSIISQQISGAAARTILGRLREWAGSERVAPEQLADVSLETLRELGISRQKGTYLLDLASQVAEGNVRLPSIHRLNDEEVIAELVQVKGIGVWTAQMFLMFCLGRLDVLPVGDLGIQKAIREAYQPRGRFDDQRVVQIGSPWAPYRTIASWYLWRSLDLEG